jgi:hypothetical protein
MGPRRDVRDADPLCTAEKEFPKPKHEAELRQTITQTGIRVTQKDSQVHWVGKGKLGGGRKLEVLCAPLGKPVS